MYSPVLGKLPNMKNEPERIGLREHQLPSSALPGYRGRDWKADLFRSLLLFSLLPPQLEDVVGIGVLLRPWGWCPWPWCSSLVLSALHRRSEEDRGKGEGGGWIHR